MSTRFSPEHGYIVESRRGGGGYIRITRVHVDRQTLMMHVINSIGSEIDPASARAILSNLVQSEAIPAQTGKLLVSLLSDAALPVSYTHLLELLGDRPAALCRELTKLHEETIRTTLAGAVALYREKEPRGEYVLVVAGDVYKRQVSAMASSAVSWMVWPSCHPVSYTHLDVYKRQKP